MSIRARMTLLVTISVLFTAGLVATLLWTVVMDQRVEECLAQAREVSDAVFDLTLITSDYAVLPTERAEVQWRMRYGSLGDLLDGATPCERVPVDLSQTVGPGYERLGQLFAELTEHVETAGVGSRADLSPYGIRLAAQLRITAQSISDDALAYQRTIAESQQRTRSRTVALAIAIAVTSVLLVAGTAFSSWRLLAEPLVRLRDGARILAAGDLDHRFDIEQKGEVGEVARAFDEMAEELAASNRALEAEIAERRAAEEQVRHAKRDVERIVEQRTAQLVETNLRLEEATATKDRFMARMSHELRTPLNSIIGFGTVMASGAAGPLTEEQERQLRMIANSGKRLLALVDDLLDISIISAGGVRIDCAPLDLGEFGSSLVETIEPLARAKGLEMKYVAQDAGGITTDRARLEQVMMNLLGNAVKFTDEGTISLSISRTTGGGARLAVSDTGIGIDAEDLDHIFAEFSQLSPPADRVNEGTGLGLAIARSLTVLLGGKIAVESALGEGSTFTVTLPACAPDDDRAVHSA